MSQNIYTDGSLKKISGNYSNVDAELNTTSTSPVQNKVVTAAISQINEDLTESYQKKTDDSLATSAKTVVGAINEINSDLSDKINMHIKHLGWETLGTGNGVTFTFPESTVSRRPFLMMCADQNQNDTVVIGFYSSGVTGHVISGSGTFYAENLTATISLTDSWADGFVIY